MSLIISGFTSSGPSDPLRPSNYSPVDINVSAKGSSDANDYILLGGEIALADAVAVANPAASRLRHGPCFRITAVFFKPVRGPAHALSQALPTLPAEGSIPDRFIWKE